MSQYKRYPKYKPSGVEWIGDIPEGWEVRKIKHVFKVLNGSTPKSTNSDYWDGDIYWATPDDLSKIDTNGYLSETRRKITKEGYRNCGTILSSERSLIISTRAPIGYVAMMTKAMCCNQGCRMLEDMGGQYENRYSYYFLKSANSELNNLGQGTTFKELSRNELMGFNVLCFLIKEQQQIANFLDKKTGMIDELIDKKEKMTKLLKQKRAAMINQAVTCGIDENGHLRQKPKCLPASGWKPSGIEWIGDIPEGWEKKKLKYISKINSNALPEDTDENFEFYYIDIGNVSLENGFLKGEKIVFSEAPSRARRIVQTGDTIISTVRTYLKAIAYIDEKGDELIVSTGFAVVIPREEINNRYLYYSFCSERVVQTISAISVGVSYPATNASDIADIFFVFPSKKEQENVVSYLDKRTTEIDDLIGKTKAVINKLREYRTSIITAAVTGKIDVREVGI